MLNKFIAIAAILWSTVSGAATTVISDDAGVALKTDKVVDITGSITQYTEFNFALKLKEIAKLKGPLVVLVDSPGGEVDAGMNMINEIIDLKNKGTKIICINMKEASSMAFNFMSFCDVRYVTAGSSSLMHKIFFGYWTGIGKLNAKNLRRAASQLEKIDAPFRRQNATTLSLTLKEYDKLADAETRLNESQLIDSGWAFARALVLQE